MKESSKIIDSFVLYGVLGDLSVRKLIPAWYYLERDSMLSGSLQILGVGRKKISDSELKNTLKKSLETYVPSEYLDQTIVSTLIDRFSYCSCDLQSPDSYQKLKLKVQDWNMPRTHSELAMNIWRKQGQILLLKKVQLSALMTTFDIQDVCFTPID